MTIDNRTILCGEQLGKNYTWILHEDSATRKKITGAAFRAGQVAAPNTACKTFSITLPVWNDRRMNATWMAKLSLYVVPRIRDTPEKVVR